MMRLLFALLLVASNALAQTTVVTTAANAPIRGNAPITGTTITATTALALGANPVTPDVFLYRDSANVLSLRNSTNAQAFYVTNTYTDGTLYERGKLLWASNIWTIATEAAGAGVQRAMHLGAANIRFVIGGTGVWDITAAGILAPVSNNTRDLGTGALTVRTGYFGTSIVTPKVTGTAFIFANIATALTANGEFGYCSDCTIANPCAGGGTGAIAKRLNGVNVCN